MVRIPRSQVERLRALRHARDDLRARLFREPTASELAARTGVSVAEVGREIFEKILAVDSGERTKSEVNGVGEEEFAPWSIGPTL